MRSAWVALPALLATASCTGLNPARLYQEAARELRFTLDRVEPSLQLAFPLEDSQVGIRIMVGVENPTPVHFKATTWAGRIYLDEGTQNHPIGQISVEKGIDLAPNGRSQVPMELSLSYRELNQAWNPLTAAIRSHKGAWRLEGSLQVVAFGIPITLPVRVVRLMGN